MVMPFGTFGMGGMTSGNVYQNLRARYSCGYVDYAERPKLAGYPVETNSDCKRPERPKSFFERVVEKLFK